MDIYLLFWRVA